MFLFRNKSISTPLTATGELFNGTSCIFHDSFEENYNCFDLSSHTCLPSAGNLKTCLV